MTRWQRYNLRHPDRRKAAAARYRAKNREKRNAQKREWARRNVEHVRKYQAQWASKQPAKFWNHWPSRPPQRTRKPGRTRMQTIEANRAIQRRQRDVLSNSYLRPQAVLRMKPIDTVRNSIALKRSRKVLNLFAALETLCKP